MTSKEKPEMSTYLFDNAAPRAGACFASLEALYDQRTIHHLEATNVGAGARCLEVRARADGRSAEAGGWLVIEDFDMLQVDRGYASDDAEAMALCQKMFAAVHHLVAAHGAGHTWGRGLYRRLRAHGLVEVGMEGHLAVWPADPPASICSGPISSKSGRRRSRRA